MGYIDTQIHRLKTTLVLFLIFILHLSLMAQEEEVGHVAFGVTFPFYQEKGTLPVLILRCDKAMPIGVRVEMEGVQLDWIGKTLEDIQGVVITPSAVYDKTTQKITGNEKITYRSDKMDLDGVGFDMDQVKQHLHIRSKVKVVLNKLLEHERDKVKTQSGVTPALNLGKIEIGKSLKNLKIERLDDGAKDQAEDKELKRQDNESKIEIEENREVPFGWSSLIWFVVLVIGAIFVIKVLLMRKRRKK